MSGVTGGEVHAGEWIGCRQGTVERGLRRTAIAPAAARCSFIRDFVGCAFGIDAQAMRSPTRQRAPVAYARQVAMYLSHVACGMTLTDVGRAFGRDRTTVAHACRLVEDRRDEPDTDMALEYLEGAIAGWLRWHGVLSGAAGSAAARTGPEACHADR